MWSLLSVGLAAAAPCLEWGEGVEEPPVEGEIEESSGLAFSRVVEGRIYSHEDSGRPAELWLFEGGLATPLPVDGAENDDWEDISALPCPDEPERRCLAIGDIGDNPRTRDEVGIYIIYEPEVGATRAEVERYFELTWPDGSTDSEALTVTPMGIWLFRKDPSEVGLVAHTAILEDGARGELEIIAELVLPGEEGVDHLITGADVDEDFTQLIVRTYTRALYWQLEPLDPIGSLASPPQELVVPLQIQSEAATFDLSGDIWLGAEGKPTPLSRVPCLLDAEPEEDSGGPGDSGEAEDSGVLGGGETDSPAPSGESGGEPLAGGKEEEGGCAAALLPWPLLLLRRRRV